MTDQNGLITRFMEKPSWGEVFSDTVNTGIYIMEPELLERVPLDQEFDFSQQLFPALLQENRALYGYVSSGYWMDIGNLQQYRQTQFDMLDGKVQLHIHGTQIRPRVYIADDVETSDTALVVGPALSAKGARLRMALNSENTASSGKITGFPKAASLRAVCFGTITTLPPTTNYPVRR